MDLRALDDELNRRPYGLIALAAAAGDDVRRALWQVLARCETLYWLGPLAEKPVVDGPATCWLLECPLADRAQGLRVLLRRDPHAIHVIGVVDDAFVPALVNAALTGHVIVAELDAGGADDVIAALRRAPLEAGLLDACLVAGIGADGALSLVRAAR